MILKAVMLFLVGVAVLGMFGKWRLPKRRREKPGTAIESARKCGTCGVYRLAVEPDPCARADCPQRRAS